MSHRRRSFVRYLPALAAILLATLVLPGPVADISGQPPTTTFPAIYKMIGGGTIFGLGDQVEFRVTVANELSAEAITWYNVRATDEVDPRLRVDGISVHGTYDTASLAHNTVVVTADSLLPGQYFWVDIYCTIVSGPGSDPIVANVAQLVFENEAGDPFGPLASDPVWIELVGRLFLPVVLNP